jgi:hypothetical protein
MELEAQFINSLVVDFHKGMKGGCISSRSPVIYLYHCPRVYTKNQFWFGFLGHLRFEASTIL